MSLTVQSNSASMNAQGNLSRSHRALGQSFARISSGHRITNAADDAAGLGVAENLDSTARAANVAKRNINDGKRGGGVLWNYERHLSRIIRRDGEKRRR